MADTPTDNNLQNSSDRRALALDALRGLAILLMCLSGILPGVLPNWMYHGYYPTSLPATLNAEASAIAAGPGNNLGLWEEVPQKRFRGDWPSLTWVDVVFPMFLFAMGAAIPLAIGARRARGDSRWKLARGAFVRFGLLVGFAVYAQHVTPYFMENPPGIATWWVALLAMVPAGMVLTRLPRGWRRWSKTALRGVGWTSAIALVTLSHVRSDKPFSWNDKDIIILLLAWSSLLVTLAAIAAGRWVWLRLLLVLPIAGVAHHQAMSSGWRMFGDTFDAWMPWLQSPKTWLDRSVWSGPLPDQVLNFSGLYDFTWFKFTGIVVFGTLVGDVLWNRQAGPTQSTNTLRRGWVGDLALTALLLTAVVGTLVGLKDYATTFFTVGGLSVATPYAAMGLGGVPASLALWFCFVRKRRDDPDWRYLFLLTSYGASFLIVGIFLAVIPGPALDTAFGFFEGGIKKGPPATLSWYLVSLGVSVLTLTAFALWLDVRRVIWPCGWLIANGQNPMLAYLGIRNLLAPLVALPVFWWSAEAGTRSLNGLMLGRVLDGGQGEAVVWAGVQMLGLALVVWGLTQRGVVWRS